MEKLHFIHSHKPDSEQAIILLHGAGAGLESPFMNDLFQAVDRLPADVLAVEFPFATTGSKPSTDLSEEVHALHCATEFMRKELKKVTIIAKSLGGIVASKWLGNPYNEASLYVLGYVLGEENMQTQHLGGHLKGVVQGELDRFGNASDVVAELREHGVAAPVAEVLKADHSYRDLHKNPKYEAKAIDMLLQLVDARSVNSKNQ